MMLESAEYLRANDTKYQHSARPHPRQLGEKHFFLGAQQLLLGTTITISTTVMSCKDKIGGVQQHVPFLRQVGSQHQTQVVLKKIGACCC